MSISPLISHHTHTSYRGQNRKRLGILLPTAGASFYQHLCDGFMQACLRLGVAGECISAVCLDDPPSTLYQWAHDHAAAFDGLVVTREAPMLPLLSAFSDGGVQVGQRIDLVLKYSSPLPQYIRQPLWACFEDMHHAGHSLGVHMLARFSHPGQAMVQELFLPHLETIHATS